MILTAGDAGRGVRTVPAGSVEYLEIPVTQRDGTPSATDSVEVGLGDTEAIVWQPATWEHASLARGRIVIARALVDTTGMAGTRDVYVRITGGVKVALRKAGILAIGTDQSRDHVLYAMF